MVHLDYRDARPIYTQIVDGFQEQILSGILRQGDKLPSVRELATQLTINPNTIQRAYRELEGKGWIVSVPGKGCFVSGVPLEKQTEQMAPFRDFDRAVAQLMAMGVTRQELVLRLNEGGIRDA